MSQGNDQAVSDDEVTKIPCPCCGRSGFAEILPVGPRRPGKSGTYHRVVVCGLCDGAGFVTPADAARWRGLAKLAQLG